MDPVVEVGVLQVLVLQQVDVRVDGEVLADGVCVGADEGALQGVDVLRLDEAQLLLLIEVDVLDAGEEPVSFQDFLIGFEEFILEHVQNFALLLGEHLAVLLEEFMDLVVERADDSVGLLDERMLVLALDHVVVDAADGEEATVGEQVHQLYALPLLQVQYPPQLDLGDYLLVDQLDLEAFDQVLVDPAVHLVLLGHVLWHLLLHHPLLQHFVGVLRYDLEFAQEGGEIALQGFLIRFAHLEDRRRDEVDISHLRPRHSLLVLVLEDVVVDQLLPPDSVILIDADGLPQEVAHLHCRSDALARDPAFLVDAAALNLIQERLFLPRLEGEVSEDHLEHYDPRRPYVSLSKPSRYLQPVRLAVHHLWRHVGDGP